MLSWCPLDLDISSQERRTVAGMHTDTESFSGASRGEAEAPGASHA